MVGKVFSIPVRLAFTLVLLGVPFLAGLSFVNPWWILPMTFVFVMADVMGKWRLLFQGEPLSKPALFALKALAVQPIVVGIVYLLGRGFGSITGMPGVSPFAGGMTATHIGIYALVMFAAGLVLMRVERDKPDLEAVIAQALGADVDEDAEFEDAEFEDTELEDTELEDTGLTAKAVPVTLETFFDGHHYSNCEYDSDHKLVKVLPSANVSEAEIDAHEKVLGIPALPPLLRQLYLRQNGGAVENVYVGGATPKEDDVQPFSGYEELAPLTNMRSLYDSITDYADENEPEMFPKGARKMIILAQWYRLTLYLDYRDNGTPTVGFYDFDLSGDLRDDTWEDEAVTWPDFDAFFAQLYRQDRYQ